MGLLVVGLAGLVVVASLAALVVYLVTRGADVGNESADDRPSARPE